MNNSLGDEKRKFHETAIGKTVNFLYRISPADEYDKENLVCGSLCLLLLR